MRFSARGLVESAPIYKARLETGFANWRAFLDRLNYDMGQQNLHDAIRRLPLTQWAGNLAGRALGLVTSGGLVLDLPGIRELKVGEVGAGVDEVFDDIGALAKRCRFADCKHHDEPGCAVRQAISDGQLDERRLRNYEKLAREDARHTATLAEQRQQDKAFGKMVKQHVSIKKRR